jgi:hypothetical protein
MEKLAVRGYLEVLPRLPELLRIRRQLRDRLLVEQPELFIGVDAPDFNFGLEARLRAGGIKTVHFVCPSIWAWRPEKLVKLKAAADHVLCLFPFEPALLAAHGIAATYVGHPLASVIPCSPTARRRRRWACPPADPWWPAAGQPRGRDRTPGASLLSGGSRIGASAICYSIRSARGAAACWRACRRWRRPAGWAMPCRCCPASRTPRWPPATSR